MPEQPVKPQDVGDSMPVNDEARMKRAPMSGPVPSAETPEARQAREREEGRSVRVGRSAPVYRDMDENGDDEAAALPTPTEQFNERHPAEVRAHAKAMQKQQEARVQLRGELEPQTLRHMGPVKSNDPEDTEPRIENNRRLVQQAAHQALGDETRLAEMRRAYGDYPGRLFTLNAEALNEVKSLEVRPADSPDVVTVFPQGLSSRHVPETRTAY
jgi:hypothetical protein